MEHGEQRCRATHVIRMRMRKHEQRQRAAVVRQIGRHSVTSRVAANPGATRVHGDPATARGAQCQCVPLPHVDHVQLRHPANARHERFEHQHTEAGCDNNQGAPRMAGRPVIARATSLRERQVRPLSSDTATSVMP